MRSVLKILIFNLVTQIAFGQGKLLTLNSDTVYWYKFYNSLANKIGLDTSKNVKAEFYFRYWDGCSVIEIIRNGNQISGYVTFFLKQYKRSKEGRIYFKGWPVSQERSIKILSLITKYELLNMPTDKKINGWQQGLDGLTYITEHSDSLNYSFKNYWTPTFQKNLIEADQFLNFISELNNIEELNKMYKKFMTLQPFSSWFSDIGQSIIVTKITNVR